MGKKWWCHLPQKREDGDRDNIFSADDDDEEDDFVFAIHVVEDGYNSGRPTVLVPDLICDVYKFHY